MRECVSGGGGEGKERRERDSYCERVWVVSQYEIIEFVFPHSTRNMHGILEQIFSHQAVPNVLSYPLRISKWKARMQRIWSHSYLLGGAFAWPLIGCSKARAEQVCVLPRPLLLDHSLSNNRRLSYSGCLEIWGVELPNWSKYSSSLIRPDPAARWRGVRPIRCDLLVKAC